MSMIALSRIFMSENSRSIPGTEGIDDLMAAPIEEFPAEFQEKVKGLAASIKEHGLLNPLTVKDLGGGEKFRLIAGFRRFKALQYLGRTTCDVKSVKGKSSSESSAQLVENIQREDLNHLDIAKALVKIREQRGATNKQLAEIVGKSSAWVSQHLAILRSDESIQNAVASGEIGLGAARTFATVPKGEQKEAIASAKKEAASSKKKKVTVAGARRQARKSKAKSEGKQLTIKPIDEREAEQRALLIDDFLSAHYGDVKVPDDVKEAVEAFWRFLFRKNRLHLTR